MSFDAAKLPVIPLDALRRHATPSSLWIAIDGLVYDVTTFVDMHPGGSKLLEQAAGQDASEAFFELHRKDILERPKYRKRVVGRLKDATLPDADSSNISQVPFAELMAFRLDCHSPYFNDSHKRFLSGMKSYVQTELVPIAREMDMNGDFPDKDLKRALGKAGQLVTKLGPGIWMDNLSELGIQLPGNIDPKSFDYFHEMIAHQETARIGFPGFTDSIAAGWMISVPAIYNFGTEEMRRTIGSRLLTGELQSCLAISEPWAGSDVANIKTTAVLSPDHTHYIVNGVKKWITEGMYSDYFVTAVRTGGDGAGGISMMLIERGEGVETKLIKTTYSTCPGTALVIFQDVKVPLQNLLGEKNTGFKKIMYNFNHERWAIVQTVLGHARAAITDTFLWAKQRKVFGKSLISQPVIRYKLATSLAALESVQSLNESITYDMCKSKEGPLGSKLAGPIGMLKFQATRAAWQIADDCVQIFGGRGITRSGMGAKVEGFKNFVKYCAVYGGSEEIMADLTIKQALKAFPLQARL